MAAQMVRLRSPRGKVGTYHPDEYDIPRMLKAGFTRAGEVMVPAHKRSMPQSRKQETTFTPGEMAGAGITPQTPQREEPWLVKNLPGAGGMVGDILGRAAGGSIAGAVGAAATAPALGAGGIPAAVIGQEVGGPLGATVGGAGGEAIRQLIDRAIGIDAPGTPQEALAAMGTEGLTQGGLSVVGGAAGAGVKATGRLAMRGALKFTPEVAQTAIREGITATRQGVKKLGARLGEYGGQVMGMLRHSTAIGNRFDPQMFLDGAEQSLKDLLEKDRAGNPATGRLPEHGEMKAKFEELSNQFLKDNAPLGEMTPLELQRIKTDADAIAKPLWKQIDNKENVVPVDRARAYWYKALGDHARDLLERTTPDMVDPVTGKTVSLAEVNARNSDLIRLKAVIAPDVKTSPGVIGRIAARSAGPAIGAGVGAMVPGDRSRHSLEGAVAGAALTSPEALSWLALRLNSPAVAATLRQVPRGIGALGSEPRRSRK